MPGTTLTIDIGGSKIKAASFDNCGNILHEYSKLPTPNPATPVNVIDAIKQLVDGFVFDQVSVGFPGYVRDGMVHTAPNLGTGYWAGLHFADKLSEALGKPVRVVNDADMLGLGVVSGKGFEMMVTLGTGVGTALYLDGKLLPHLEVSHHPIKDGKDYDEYIGEATYKKIGDEKWNKRIAFVFDILKTVFNYDRIYIGGGLAKKITNPLTPDMVIVTNKQGIDGGVKLWE